MTRSLMVLMLALAWALPSAAQTYPAGNEHPESRALSESGESLANPFGRPTFESIRWTPEEARAAMLAKRELAAAVDLSPLRDLAVFHSGRVKIMDTLARETVSRIVGRGRYTDFLREEGSAAPRAERIGYDPLFTLLDLMIDPGYYFDKPLFHINYLPLRQAFLHAQFPDDETLRDRWLRKGRITPMMIQVHGQEVADRYGLTPGYAESLTRLDRSVSLWENSAANMFLIAPRSHEQPWVHLSAYPEDSPARRAAAELGRAWRAGDAELVNAAVRRLAAELPAINPGVYPDTRRAVELAYNRSNAFEWGYWVYFLSLVLLLLAFGTGRKWLIFAGVAALFAAIALHGFGFVLRSIIAERYAIQNQFESITGVSLFGSVLATGLMIWKRQWLFGAAAAGAGFLALVTATQTGVPGQFIEREAAILNTSVLLKYHVTTVLVSYGLISLGFIISLFYLGTHYFARGPSGAGFQAAPLAEGSSKGLSFHSAPVMVTAALNLPEDKPRGRQRTLADLDTAQMTVLQLAFWTLGVGILLGAWWADHSWGRWWAWDPKEAWALITWIVYLIVIHLRFATTGPRRGLTTAWLSVLGFFVMLWTYFGVNLLLPGLHAYA